MTAENIFVQFVNGIAFGSGLIAAATIFKLVFHVGFC